MCDSTQSHHDPPHPLNDAEIVEDSVDRHPQCNGEVLSIINRSCIHRGFRAPHPED
jgi:hypothetical protein